MLEIKGMVKKYSTSFLRRIRKKWILLIARSIIVLFLLTALVTYSVRESRNPNGNGSMTGMESEKSKLNEYGNKSLDLSFAYPEGWGVAETKNCHKYFKSDFENDCVDIVKDGYSVRIVLVALIGDEGHGYYDEYDLQSSKVLWVNGRKVFRSKYLNMTGEAEYSSGIGLLFAAGNTDEQFVEYYQTAEITEGRSIMIGYFFPQTDEFHYGKEVTAKELGIMDTIVESIHWN